MPPSRGSSQPRDWTQVSCIAGRFFTIWATREALQCTESVHKRYPLKLSSSSPLWLGQGPWKAELYYPNSVSFSKAVVLKLQHAAESTRGLVTTQVRIASRNDGGITSSRLATALGDVVFVDSMTANELSSPVTASLLPAQRLPLTHAFTLQPVLYCSFHSPEVCEPSN